MPSFLDRAESHLNQFLPLNLRHQGLYEALEEMTFGEGSRGRVEVEKLLETNEEYGNSFEMIRGGGGLRLFHFDANPEKNLPALTINPRELAVNPQVIHIDGGNRLWRMPSHSMILNTVTHAQCDLGGGCSAAAVWAGAHNGGKSWQQVVDGLNSRQQVLKIGGPEDGFKFKMTGPDARTFTKDLALEEYLMSEGFEILPGGHRNLEEVVGEYPESIISINRGYPLKHVFAVREGLPVDAAANFWPSWGWSDPFAGPVHSNKNLNFIAVRD